MAGKGKNKGGGGGGGGAGGSRVFIASTKVEKSGKKFNLTVELQQTHQNPTFPIPTRVFFQGKYLGVIPVERSATQAFQDIEPDESKPAEVRIEKAGFSGQGEGLVIHLKPEKAAQAPAPKKRFRISVGYPRPDDSNPVHFFTYDEQGRAAKGMIRIDAGQKLWVNRQEYANNVLYDHPTDDSGTNSVDIELEYTAPVTFIHLESGEILVRWLKGKSEKGETK